MLEWVVLGVDGVLEPRTSLWWAEAVAAGTWLRERGIDVPDIERQCFEKRRAGDPAAVRTGLESLEIRLERAAERELLLHVRQAVPAPRPGAALRPLLQTLRQICPIAYVDGGPGPRLQAWVEALGIADLAARRLWISDLGRQALPPRRLAFRWLAQRLEAPTDRCLYVAGSHDLAVAAGACGFRVLLAPMDSSQLPLAGDAASPLESLLDPIEALARDFEAAI